jgi:hypothetical protein
MSIASAHSPFFLAVGKMAKSFSFDTLWVAFPPEIQLEIADRTEADVRLCLALTCKHWWTGVGPLSLKGPIPPHRLIQAALANAFVGMRTAVYIVLMDWYRPQRIRSTGGPLRGPSVPLYNPSQDELWAMPSTVATWLAAMRIRYTAMMDGSKNLRWVLPLALQSPVDAKPIYDMMLRGIQKRKIPAIEVIWGAVASKASMAGSTFLAMTMTYRSLANICKTRRILPIVLLAAICHDNELLLAYAFGRAEGSDILKVFADLLMARVEKSPWAPTLLGKFMLMIEAENPVATTASKCSQQWVAAHLQPILVILFNHYRGPDLVDVAIRKFVRRHFWDVLPTDVVPTRSDLLNSYVMGKAEDLEKEDQEALTQRLTVVFEFYPLGRADGGNVVWTISQIVLAWAVMTKRQEVDANHLLFGLLTNGQFDADVVHHECIMLPGEGLTAVQWRFLHERYPCFYADSTVRWWREHGFKLVTMESLRSWLRFVPMDRLTMHAMNQLMPSIAVTLRQYNADTADGVKDATPSEVSMGLRFPTRVANDAPAIIRRRLGIMPTAHVKLSTTQAIRSVITTPADSLRGREDPFAAGLIGHIPPLRAGRTMLQWDDWIPDEDAPGLELSDHEEEQDEEPPPAEDSGDDDEMPPLQDSPRH